MGVLQTLQIMYSFVLGISPPIFLNILLMCSSFCAWEEKSMFIFFLKWFADNYRIYTYCYHSSFRMNPLSSTTNPSFFCHCSCTVGGKPCDILLVQKRTVIFCMALDNVLGRASTWRAPLPSSSRSKSIPIVRSQSEAPSTCTSFGHAPTARPPATTQNAEQS